MTARLDGRRILVVEDEYFIASDLRRALEERGAIVVGPTGRLDEALALAAQPLDAALLDLNLEGDYSYAIADRLAGVGVPYMFLTGYDRWVVPAAYRHVPHVAKPFPMEALMARIGGLVAGHGGVGDAP